jgi:hypothetical protein
MCHCRAHCHTQSGACPTQPHNTAHCRTHCRTQCTAANSRAQLRTATLPESLRELRPHTTKRTIYHILPSAQVHTATRATAAHSSAYNYTLPHCPTKPNCQTSHTLTSALPHTAAHTTRTAHRLVPCALPHTNYTTIHTHCRTRCCTQPLALPHAATLPHCRTALPQPATHTAIHYEAHCRKPPHCRTAGQPHTAARAAIYCQAHYRILLRALHIPCVTTPRIATHNQALLAAHSHTIPHTSAHTAARSALPRTAAHCHTAGHPHTTKRTIYHILPSALPHTAAHCHAHYSRTLTSAHNHTLPHCPTKPNCQTSHTLTKRTAAHSRAHYANCAQN